VQYLADHVALTFSVSQRRGLRSADTHSGSKVLRTRLSFADRAFSVAGLCAWNSLPINVHFAQSMHSFGKLLKRFYSIARILDLNSCLNIVRRPCSILFCVRHLKCVLHYILYVTLQPTLTNYSVCRTLWLVQSPTQDALSII